MTRLQGSGRTKPRLPLASSYADPGGLVSTVQTTKTDLERQQLRTRPEAPAAGGPGVQLRHDSGINITALRRILNLIPGTNITITITDKPPNEVDVEIEATGGGGGTFGTPAIVLGTVAADGVIDEVIRRDATIIAFDVTAPVTQAIGDVAATGSVAKGARRDHKHGMPAFGTPAIVLGTAAAAGSSPDLIRRDATILAFDVTSPADVAAAAAVGVATVAPRRDHGHRGVASFRKSGDTLLYGAVTVSAGANITLTQTGQDIAIASTASGGGDPVDLWLRGVLGA